MRSLVLKRPTRFLRRRRRVQRLSQLCNHNPSRSWLGRNLSRNTPHHRQSSPSARQDQEADARTSRARPRKNCRSNPSKFLNVRKAAVARQAWSLVTDQRAALPRLNNSSRRKDCYNPFLPKQHRLKRQVSLLSQQIPWLPVPCQATVKAKPQTKKPHCCASSTAPNCLHLQSMSLKQQHQCRQCPRPRRLPALAVLLQQAALVLLLPQAPAPPTSAAAGPWSARSAKSRRPAACPVRRA